jgi:hypothetical protein
MEIAEQVDYAPHYLRAKVLLGETYKLLNERRFIEAEELAFQLLAEVKLLNNAIRTHK